MSATTQGPHRRHFDEPGHAHELTFSCYRRFRFLAAERTCLWLAQAIDQARRRHGFAVWAYVFMPEHVHLIVHPGRPLPRVELILKAIKQPVRRRTVLHLGRHAPAGFPGSPASGPAGSNASSGSREAATIGTSSNLGPSRWAWIIFTLTRCAAAWSSEPPNGGGPAPAGSRARPRIRCTPTRSPSSCATPERPIQSGVTRTLPRPPARKDTMHRQGDERLRLESFVEVSPPSRQVGIRKEAGSHREPGTMPVQPGKASSRRTFQASGPRGCLRASGRRRAMGSVFTRYAMTSSSPSRQ
jgi:hypothetical protein